MTQHLRLVVSLAALSSPPALADQLFYGASSTGGGIVRMDLDGANQTFIEPATQAWTGIGVDSAHGILFRSTTFGPAGPGIFRTDLNGGGDGIVVPEVRTDSIAVDGGHNRMCWGEREVLRCSGIDGTGIVDVAPLPTGDPMVSPSFGPIAIDLDNGGLFWLLISGLEGSVFREGVATPIRTRTCDAGSLAIDHIARRLITNCNGVIETSNLDGSDVTVVATVPFSTRGLSVDPFQGQLYLDDSTGSMHRLDLDTGAIVQIAAVGSSRGSAIALDALRVDTCSVFETATGATIVCPDGSVATISDGSNGVDGVDGVDGTDGASGADGTNGSDGVDGTDGANGANGTNGTNGTNGSDGVAGTDGVDGVNGADGAAGPSCTVVEEDDGSATITCPDGSEATVSGGGCATTPPSSFVPALLGLLALRRRRQR